VSALRRKLSLVLTLCAWFFASGSQWEIVQVFAWIRMFSENVQTLSLRAAVRRTLSPEGRCRLCKAVASARQQQDDPALPGTKMTGKMTLVFEPTPTVLVIAPPFAPWPWVTTPARSTLRSRPPLPPPRV